MLDDRLPLSRFDFVETAAHIVLEGVRVHNLKSVNVRIRHQALTVICGVSGSGKSSLAFDTLYAEGQRRYIETFSPSARQFLDRIERPDADRIDEIPPAIAMRQGQRSQSFRSTVGTRTEILNHLRLFFVRGGQVICPDCRLEAPRFTSERAADWLLTHFPGRRILIAADYPVEPRSSRRETTDALLNGLRQNGLTRLLLDQRIQRIDALPPDFLISAPPAGPAAVTVILDRIRVDPQNGSRLTESLETAFQTGDSECVVYCETELPDAAGSGSADLQPASSVPDQSTAAAPFLHGHAVIDGVRWHTFCFSWQRKCLSCGRQLPECGPELLNFQTPLGACPRCEGTGRVPADTVDRADSGSSFTARQRPGRRKTREQRNRSESRVPCPVCCGSRLNPDAECIQLAGMGLSAVCELELDAVLRWVQEVYRALPDDRQAAVRMLIRPLLDRLEYLIDCGLGYLTLNRSLSTLSGGEAQRVRLTSALGSGLIHTLYVLDEPTSGLHVDDTRRVIRATRRLQQAGNTLVVVEHDPQFILAADEIIEIGPGAGSLGGEVVFQGTPQELLASDTSLTGRRLRESPKTTSASDMVVETPGGEPERWLTAADVTCHNIQHLTVRLPLEVMAAITGVSGSGKSSLIVDSLYPAICRALGQPCQAEAVGTVGQLTGVQQIDRVMLLDQQPLHASRRSIPATWIGAFQDIRTLLAETHEARKRNLTAAAFSFNSARGGRCPVCEGTGTVTVDMQFLANIETICEECRGRRFRPDILEIRYRDRSVQEILDMTADEAFQFLSGHHRIQQRVNALRQAGLGYLRLGQPLSTLSGGEAQRLRISALLAGIPLEDGIPVAQRRAAAAARGGRTLFLLDEPSTGLHLQDIDRLISCLRFLVQTGHSVILVDHDDYLIAQSDYVIHMGPGPGSQGGQIVREECTPHRNLVRIRQSDGESRADLRE